MTRLHLLTAALPALLVAALSASAGRAQDRITYFDRDQKKEVTTAGTISKESPAGVTMAGKTIAPTDVIDIVYDTLKVEARQNYTGGVKKEKDAQASAKDADRKKGFTDALTSYRDALRTAPAGAAPARRLIQFRLASTAARQADDAGTPAVGVKELRDFASKNADSWQAVLALRQLARLQLKAKDIEGAVKTFEELAKLPGLPKDLQQDAELQGVEALLGDPKMAAAAADRLKSLPDSPKVKVYRARLAADGKTGLQQAIKDLQTAIDGSPDPELKAVAYNAMGDCYLQNNQVRDAMWAYLFVDLVYNQNREQHQRAMAKLGDVFTQLKDEKRAQDYQARARQ